MSFPRYVVLSLRVYIPLFDHRDGPIGSSKCLRSAAVTRARRRRRRSGLPLRACVSPMTFAITSTPDLLSAMQMDVDQYRQVRAVRDTPLP